MAEPLFPARAAVALCRWCAIGASWLALWGEVLSRRGKTCVLPQVLGLNPPGQAVPLPKSILCVPTEFGLLCTHVYPHVRLLRSDAAPRLDIQRVAIRCSLGT